VKLTRTGLLATAAIGTIALALTACSSDKGSTSSSSVPAGGSSIASSSASSSVAATTCASGKLDSDGSTAQANAMTQWIKDYQTKCSGSTINYAGGGSGQGVTDFNGGKVQFAGSDSALSAAKGEIAAAATRCGSAAIDLPMVTGPVALAFNVKGLAKLTLTPALIDQIFLGKVTTWNDPAIAAVNKGVTLPSTAITVYYRSDQSGTTQNFESYLQAADAANYTTLVPADKQTPSKVWFGTVGQGKSGSQGVQQGIQGQDGSIGYLEYSFAVNGGLATAAVDNGGGAVDLSATSAGKAVEAATIVGTGDDLSLKLDYATKAAGAYPIILVTYEIACAKYADPTQGSLVKSFLSYTSNEGQAALKQLGYAPLPASILAKVQASVAKIS
jgi:phosphate transport system substrate-binding protein